MRTQVLYVEDDVSPPVSVRLQRSTCVGAAFRLAQGMPSGCRALSIVHDLLSLLYVGYVLLSPQPYASRTDEISVQLVYPC